MRKQQELRTNFINQIKANSFFDPIRPNRSETNVLPWRVLSVAVQLPNGAVEIITNYTNLKEKIMYYLEKYNEDFRMVNNPEVKIIGYMLV